MDLHRKNFYVILMYQSKSTLMGKNNIDTVGDLVKELQKFDAKLPIEFALTQYNKAYPIGYVKPRLLQQGNGAIRVFTPLPENEEFYTITSKRKK